MADHSIQSPTKITPDAAEGEYYDDLITQFGTRLSPPRVVDDVQHAIEALNALGLQGAQGPQGVQGSQGAQGAQGPSGAFLDFGVQTTSGPFTFSSNSFVAVTGYATIPVVSAGSYYIECSFDVLSDSPSAAGVFLDLIFNHDTDGNIGDSQRAIAVQFNDANDEVRFPVTMSLITAIANPGTISLFGNSGNSTWTFGANNTIQFIRLV